MAERREVKAPEKVDIQMTPMIDIVFQLMAFFLMTFKVAATEGDFNLKLPKAERSAGAANTQTEMITIRMRSTANGELADLQIESGAPYPANRQPFYELKQHIIRKVSAARAAGQEEPEIQIDADDKLRYENIIACVEAVSADRGENGEPIQLAKKVKFAPRAE